MILYFAISAGLGFLLLWLSYLQSRAPADAWPPGWDHPAIGAMLLVHGIIGEACLTLWR